MPFLPVVDAKPSEHATRRAVFIAFASKATCMFLFNIIFDIISDIIFWYLF